MNFAEYVTSKRTFGKKIPTDIQQRWQERVIARGLHKHGRAGAASYLSDYGRGIAAPKVIALARCAEAEGYLDMAVGFWAKAYELETGTIPSISSVGDSGASAAPKAVKPEQIVINGLPSHLTPGKIITMQPVDPKTPLNTPEWFAQSPMFCGQPKIDGQRLIIMGDPGSNFYQKRTGSIVQAPSPEIDASISVAVMRYGSFILDTECTYLDCNGNEHRTGAQAATANIDAGDPTNAVTPTIFIFDALMFDGVDLTTKPKRDRLAAISELARWLEAQTEANFIMLSPATSQEEKSALIANQRQQGREGEVWFNPNDPYRGGKDKSGFTTGVRTKHLIEREVVVTGLTPTTAAGRPFGAIEVSEVVEGNLVPRGCVGTGYTLDEMAEIARRFKAGPLAIVVRSQGLTESNQLWLGRFDSIV